MTARARPTQAEVARAIRAARREGCAVVEVTPAGVRIYVDASTAPALPSSQEGNSCDNLFDPGSD